MKAKYLIQSIFVFSIVSAIATSYTKSQTFANDKPIDFQISHSKILKQKQDGDWAIVHEHLTAAAK